MMNEQQLTEEVEEFFNEEDASVGIYAVYQIDATVVEEFKEAFEGVEVVSYGTEELEFKLDGSTYQVALSKSYECWRMSKLIRL